MSSLFRITHAAGATLLAALVGCSPTERGTGLSPAESDTPFQSGQLSGATAGPVSSPVTTTGSGATVTGLVGRFTRLAFQSGSATSDPLSSTPIFFAAAAPADGLRHIWRINYDGNDLRQITFDTVEFDPAADPVTHRVAFWKQVEGSLSHDFFAIYSMQPDGSDTAAVSGGEFCIGSKQDWAPSGNVAYDLGCDASVWETTVGKIFVFPPNGFSVVNSSAGQFLMVARQAFPPDFPVSGIFRVNYPNRDTTTMLSADSNVTFAEPVASRTPPFRLAYWKRTAPDSEWKLNLGLLSDPGNTRVIRTSRFSLGQSYPCLTWAPDGNSLLILTGGDTGARQITILDTLGQVGRQITNQGLGGVGCPSVGVPDSSTASGQGSLALIGDSALFGNTASGLIASQGSGGALQAVVAFRGTPQRSVKLETGTGLNSTAPVLTYTLRADRLTALAFTGFPAGDSAFQVVDSTATQAATGALITFDATSGAVSLILPFSSASVSQEPMVSDAGNSRTFRGRFLAAYDRRGRNLAPGGAGEAVLNLKTGMVRVRP